MAFSSTGFNAVGGQSKAGNAPAIYTYASTDAQSVIRASGYFNSVASILKVGECFVLLLNNSSKSKLI